MYTYIVSGFLRTGTSMMMKALEAGGLETVRGPKPDGMNDRFGDEHYKPNAGGFYEQAGEERNVFGFPKQHIGKLLKVFHMGLPRMAVMDYKVVFMRRHPEEIRQSLEAFFDRPIPHAVRRTLSRYDAVMDHSEAMARNRRDMHVTTFQYRDVVDNPLDYLMILTQEGWEIDPFEAAATITPGACRFKLEELEVGI